MDKTRSYIAHRKRLICNNRGRREIVPSCVWVYGARSVRPSFPIPHSRTAAKKSPIKCQTATRGHARNFSTVCILLPSVEGFADDVRVSQLLLHSCGIFLGGIWRGWRLIYVCRRFLFERHIVKKNQSRLFAENIFRCVFLHKNTGEEIIEACSSMS